MTRTLPLIAIAAAVVLSFAGSVQSQTPGVPKTALQQLQAMRLQNKTTLEKQEALLLKLEELNKDATQIKLLTKRG